MERQLRNMAAQMEDLAADYATLVGRDENGEILSSSDYWWNEHARAYLEAARSVREIADVLAGRRTRPTVVARTAPARKSA